MWSRHPSYFDPSEPIIASRRIIEKINLPILIFTMGARTGDNRIITMADYSPHFM
jgi:hypothetical protein